VTPGGARRLQEREVRRRPPDPGCGRADCWPRGVDCVCHPRVPCHSDRSGDRAPGRL